MKGYWSRPGCRLNLIFSVFLVKSIVLKENQPRMWDIREYELVVTGRPTRARRVSVGLPGTTSEYSRTSHI